MVWAGLIRFRLTDAGDLSTCGERRRAKGEKASPLAIPGPGVCPLPPDPSLTGGLPWPSAMAHPCASADSRRIHAAHSLHPASRSGRHRARNLPRPSRRLL